MRKLRTVSPIELMNVFSVLRAGAPFHFGICCWGWLVAAMVTAGVLFQIGLIGWLLRCFGYLVRTSIRGGFRTWQFLLCWAFVGQFLAMGLRFLGSAGASPADVSGFEDALQPRP